MRTPVIAANWKMHKYIGESVATALLLKPLVSTVTDCEIVVAPQFCALQAVAGALQGSKIFTAGQDCSSERKHGAHTGEVAADMLRDAGASHVIVGHSERRQFYGESNASVNRKAQAALLAGLNVILCVGESLEQRESGTAFSVVKTQLEAGLADLTASDLERIILAYEPVWAIGTGRTATPEQAQDMHAFIRRVFAENKSVDAARSLRILYGGSVNPGNISALMKEQDIDGGLVGGSSLDAETFAQIVTYDRRLQGKGAESC